MKRTTIFIDEALEREVKALAVRRGTSKAALVREALGEYVASHRRKRLDLSFLAAGRSGRSDTAERHEELLWDSPRDGAEIPESESGDDRRDGSR